MKVTVFYSPKGGQGCTTVAVAYAALGSGRVLLWDQTGTGDARRVAESGGLHVWDGADDPLDLDVWDEVVIDAGTGRVPLIRSDQRRIMVIRNCYLALARVIHGRGPRSDGVVVLREDDRNLNVEDVVMVVDAPLLGTVIVDQRITRTIDAGLLTARVPRPFIRALRGVRWPVEVTTA